MRISIQPDRTIPAKGGRASRRYISWLEVSALVEAIVPAWQYREQQWLHWAVAVSSGELDGTTLRWFDPGRRAAHPGAPEPGSEGEPRDPMLVRKLAEELVGDVSIEVLRSAASGAVSHLGEGRDAFRRRCLAALGPAVRQGALAGAEGAALVSRVGGTIEALTLEAEQLDWISVTARIGWYPEDDPPAPSPEDVLAFGAPSRERR